MYRILVLVLLLPLFTACEPTLTTHQCMQTDWYEMGLQDANKGKQLTDFNHYYDSCTKNNITPSQSQYSAGYQEGMVYYCNFTTGYRRGKQNGRPHKECPEELDYLDGYFKGLTDFRAEKQQRFIRALSLEEPGNNWHSWY